MVPFRSFINNSGLVDLGFQGNLFTWTNYKDGDEAIRSRLDRGLANTLWRTEFDKAAIVHETIIGSDHAPLILNTHFSRDQKKPPFALTLDGYPTLKQTLL
ncbi:hypothetical protein LINPERPRIM_LOCUS16870 [Linum perenne]